MIKKTFAVFFLFLFCCSFLAVPYAEASIWAERRNALKQAKEDAKPLQGPQDTLLAQLPRVRTTTLPDISSSFGQQPSVLDSLPLAAMSHIPITSLKLPLAHSNFKSAHFPAGWKPSDLTVLNIQDVHMNAEAQSNISKSLLGLIEQGKVDMVALEGAFAGVDVSGFRAFEDQEAVKMVADYFLKDNKLSGAIHAALTSPKQIPAFIGVDDKALHTAHIQAYKESVGKAEGLKNGLAKEEVALEQKKVKVYNPVLLAFDRHVTAYRKETLPLGEYVRSLAKESKQTPQVNLFVKALSMEQSLDFKKVEDERGKMVQALIKHLSQAQVSQLLNMSLSYRMGKIRNADFYVYLETLCKKAGVECGNYPAMKTYMEYALLSDQINAEKFLAELKTLEDKTYGALSKTPSERTLIRQSRQIHLTGKLLNFALTPEEWREFKAAPDANPSLSLFKSFFEHAALRDQALTYNLLAQAKAKNAKFAVLVSGGYHTEGVSEILHQQGVATITLAPKITKIEGSKGTEYLSVFTQEKTPLEKLFDGDKLFVAQTLLRLFERIELAGAITATYEARTSGPVPSEKERTAAMAMVGAGSNAGITAEDVEVGQAMAKVEGGILFPVYLSSEGDRIENVGPQKTESGILETFNQVFSFINPRLAAIASVSAVFLISVTSAFAGQHAPLDTDWSITISGMSLLYGMSGFFIMRFFIKKMVRIYARHKLLNIPIDTGPLNDLKLLQSSGRIDAEITLRLAAKNLAEATAKLKLDNNKDNRRELRVEQALYDKALIRYQAYQTSSLPAAPGGSTLATPKSKAFAERILRKSDNYRRMDESRSAATRFTSDAIHFIFATFFIAPWYEHKRLVTSPLQFILEDHGPQTLTQGILRSIGVLAIFGVMSGVAGFMFNPEIIVGTPHIALAGMSFGSMTDSAMLNAFGSVIVGLLVGIPAHFILNIPLSILDSALTTGDPSRPALPVKSQSDNLLELQSRLATAQEKATLAKVNFWAVERAFEKARTRIGGASKEQIDDYVAARSAQMAADAEVESLRTAIEQVNLSRPAAPGGPNTGLISQGSMKKAEFLENYAWFKWLQTHASFAAVSVAYFVAGLWIAPWDEKDDIVSRPVSFLLQDHMFIKINPYDTPFIKYKKRAFIGIQLLFQATSLLIVWVSMISAPFIAGYGLIHYTSGLSPPLQVLVNGFVLLYSLRIAGAQKPILNGKVVWTKREMALKEILEQPVINALAHIFFNSHVNALVHLALNVFLIPLSLILRIPLALTTGDPSRPAAQTLEEALAQARQEVVLAKSAVNEAAREVEAAKRLLNPSGPAIAVPSRTEQFRLAKAAVNAQNRLFDLETNLRLATAKVREIEGAIRAYHARPAATSMRKPGSWFPKSQAWTERWGLIGEIILPLVGAHGAALAGLDLPLLSDAWQAALLTGVFFFLPHPFTWRYYYGNWKASFTPQIGSLSFLTGLTGFFVFAGHPTVAVLMMLVQMWFHSEFQKLQPRSSTVSSDKRNIRGGETMPAGLAISLGIIAALALLALPFILPYARETYEWLMSFTGYALPANVELAGLGVLTLPVVLRPKEKTNSQVRQVASNYVGAVREILNGKEPAKLSAMARGFIGVEAMIVPHSKSFNPAFELQNIGSEKQGELWEAISDEFVSQFGLSKDLADRLAQDAVKGQFNIVSIKAALGNNIKQGGSNFASFVMPRDMTLEKFKQTELFGLTAEDGQNALLVIFCDRELTGMPAKTAGGRPIQVVVIADLYGENSNVAIAQHLEAMARQGNLQSPKFIVPASLGGWASGFIYTWKDSQQLQRFDLMTTDESGRFALFSVPILQIGESTLDVLKAITIIARSA